ncbi:hypothetical protein ACFX11_024944 [Malus domestica]
MNFHQFKIKPQRPLKKRSSFINCSSSRIKPQWPIWIDNINESVHQLFIKIKPQQPLEDLLIRCSSSLSPDGPLKNFHQFKINPRRPLKKVFIVHHPFILRSSPNGPLDQQRRQIHTSNRPSRSSPKAP